MSQTITERPFEQQTYQNESMLSPWYDRWRALSKKKLAMIGTVMIAFFVVVAVFAPWLTPYDYKAQDLLNRLQPPSATHWFGTDDLGRDIATRVLYGARISLWIGLLSVIGSVAVGTLLGVLAGFYGRWIDGVISRIFDTMLAFPGMLLAIGIVAALGPSLENAIIAISIVNIPTYGRLVQGRVLSLKEEEFIMAAKAVGMKERRLLFLHIVPNCLSPIIVQGTLGIATAVLEAAGLGFLGMGAVPPEPEWGKMLADSRQFIQNAPWTLFFPGVSIMLIVLGFNFMGDGLRDVLDPRMKQ